MRYKITGLITMLVILVLSMVLPALWKVKEVSVRVHQHQSAPVMDAQSENYEDTDCFQTHLPIVVIDTNGVTIPGEVMYDENGKTIRDEEGSAVHTVAKDGNPMVQVKLQIIDGEDGCNTLEDAPAVSTDTLIRYRGRSSRLFQKKGYELDFIQEDGTSNNLEIMGMDQHHEWALHGPYLDKTLIRNYMWYNIAGELMDYAPNVRFCEVVIDGAYEGLYLMTEKITAGETANSRLNLTVDAKKENFAGYLIRLDMGSSNPIKNIRPLSKYTYRQQRSYNIEFPGSINLTEQMAAEITRDFSSFEKCMFSYDFDDPDYGYRKRIDVDSFIDYFLINEFTCNYDVGSYSTYIHKDVDGLYHMTVWDFNNACDNYQEQAIDRENFLIQNTVWYQMLIKDEDFTKQMIRRYKALRKTYLSEAYLYNYIDETLAYLGPAVERNNERWDLAYYEQLLNPEERNLESHEEAVAQLKTFIHERGEWMDRNIDSLLQYSAMSKVKRYKEETD